MFNVYAPVAGVQDSVLLQNIPGFLDHHQDADHCDQGSSDFHGLLHAAALQVLSHAGSYGHRKPCLQRPTL